MRCGTPWLQTGKVVVLHTGNVAEILRSTMTKDLPRPYTADQARDDLIEFLGIRDREPSAAQAYQDFLIVTGSVCPPCGNQTRRLWKTARLLLA